MSTRWMAVQYVGDTLRLPIANESDMDKPFGVSELEREIRRIVVNPFSDSPRTFVPEAENAKLRSELESVGIAAYLYGRGDLQAENAKLRKRVADLEELLPDSGRWYRAETVEAYVAEIAKLRELVQRMRRYMVGAVEHYGYDAQTTGYTMLGSRLEECEDAMRELGVEVD